MFDKKEYFRKYHLLNNSEALKEKKCIYDKAYHLLNREARNKRAANYYLDNKKIIQRNQKTRREKPLKITKTPFADLPPDAFK